MSDPVSWLQIQQGWNVVSSDGIAVGTVAQVEGDKHDDIFDGLAVRVGQPAQLRYVPGEQVGAIYPGEVTLKVPFADAAAFEPFKEGAGETTWLPGRPPLTTRLANWLRRPR